MATISGRNLTRSEAAARADLIAVTSYDVALDLTEPSPSRPAPAAQTQPEGAGTFRSTTTLSFRCTGQSSSTFVELAAASLRSVTLNGVDVDPSGWSPEAGLVLSGLAGPAADNVLVVDADSPPSCCRTGSSGPPCCSASTTRPSST
jgi:aminopeptidase N